MAITGNKGGSHRPHTPTESPDSVHSTAKAKILLALGEGEFAGELDGTRIYLDGTPLNNVDGTANFTGVSWDYRPGTPSQDYIQGMPNVENEITVNRELKSNTLCRRLTISNYPRFVFASAGQRCNVRGITVM